MTNNVPLNRGEGSGGRGLPNLSRGLTSWRQTSLIPPALATIRLDVGWHAADKVGMYAAEAYVSDSRELLALEVHPSRHYPDLEDFLSRAQTWQRGVLLDIFNPDPF